MAPLLPWIVLLSPLFSAAFIVLFTQKRRDLSALISVFAVLVSFVAALGIFISAPPEKPIEFAWLDFPGFKVSIGLTLDKLSKPMLLYE